MTSPTTGDRVLEVEDLRVGFPTARGTAWAVDGIGYHLDRGETLALLGESGSGKSVSSLALMGLVEPPATVTGSVRLGGDEVLALDAAGLSDVRGRRIAMVFQDSLSALNPCLSVGFQVAEVLRRHAGASRREARRAAVELLDRVRIPDAARRARDFPHQFSGGMRQRVMIAMALAGRPDVLVADEPTTALDVTVQAQVLGLLSELQDETGMAVLLITHDLGVAAEVADRVAVMYAGRIVESADVFAAYAGPAHPYTRGLLDAVPSAADAGRTFRPIPGTPVTPARRPSGCAFHPRCDWAVDDCRTTDPVLAAVDGDEPDGRASACLRREEVLGAR